MANQIFAERKVFTFTWIIENIEYYDYIEGQSERRGRNFLQSPTFIVDTIDRTKWSLLIYPRGKDHLSDYPVINVRWTSLLLCREKDCKGPATIGVDYELAFLAVDGSVLTSQIDYKQSFLKDYCGGFVNFEERELVFAERSKFLPHGALTIRCRMWKRNREVKTDGQCIARTHIAVERKAFLWKIPNFSNFEEKRKEIFHLTSTSDDKPIVSLSFYYVYDDDAEYMESSYWIYINGFNDSIAFATFKSYIVNAQGNHINAKHSKMWPNPNAIHGFELPISKERLMDKNYMYLPHDTLTLYCEVAFSTGIAFEGIEDTVYGCSPSFITNNRISEYVNTADIKKSDSDLKVDLGSMLRNNILCDVKLCVESETFPAHWLILSARSPVFRNMFQSDMKEKAQAKIDVEDLKPDTVRRMLLYMYTDSLDELDWETTSDLYVAAEKYQIMTLKDRCSSFLKSNLSVSNACKILLLSHLHQDKELKSIVQDFIIKNGKTIINSSDWKEVMKDNVDLAAETILLKFKE